MEKKAEDIKIDYAAIKKQYEEHNAKCKQIAKEVEKWGKRTAPDLAFLKTAY